MTAEPRNSATAQPRHWAAVALLFLVATAWGMTFTVVKDVLADIAPEPFIFLRFTLAGVVLAAMALARGGLPRATFRPGLILGLLVFVGYWCQTAG